MPKLCAKFLLFLFFLFVGKKNYSVKDRLLHTLHFGTRNIWYIAPFWNFKEGNKREMCAIFLLKSHLQMNYCRFLCLRNLVIIFWCAFQSQFRLVFCANDSFHFIWTVCVCYLLRHIHEQLVQMFLIWNIYVWPLRCVSMILISFVS